MIELFFKLLIAHAVADFSLQPDAMAKGKNRNNKPEFVPKGQKFIPCWPYWLTSHALVHGGAVYIATGSFICGLVETVAHWGIDFCKCENWTNPNTDQILHFVFKIAYVAFLI